MKQDGLLKVLQKITTMDEVEEDFGRIKKRPLRIALCAFSNDPATVQIFTPGFHNGL